MPTTAKNAQQVYDNQTINTKTVERLLTNIANTHITAFEERPDLESRNLDGLDFGSVAVWELKRALYQAYLTGMAEAYKTENPK